MAYNHYKSYINPGNSGPFSFSMINFISGLSYASQIEVTLTNSLGVLSTLISGVDYTVQETQQTVTTTEDVGLLETLTIRRKTGSENKIITFSEGAQIGAASLNKALDQLLFIVQENFTYGTTLTTLPTTIFDTTGVVGGQTLVWNTITNTFKPGLPIMELDDLTSVSANSPSVDEVLTFTSSGRWQPQANGSFDSTSDLTLSGDITFTGAVVVPTATADTEAINKAQVEGIITEHASAYNSGILARITELEDNARDILGRGRWWNKNKDYWCRWDASGSSSTVPAFTYNNSNNDWDNLKNLTLSGSGYLPYFGVSMSPLENPGSYAVGVDPYRSAFLSQTQYDVFYWDFSFEDATIIPDAVDSNKPNHYHVMVSTDGVDDRMYTASVMDQYYEKGGSQVNFHYWQKRGPEAVASKTGGGPNSFGDNTWEYHHVPGYSADSTYPSRSGCVDGFPWTLDLNCFLPPQSRRVEEEFTTGAETAGTSHTHSYQRYFPATSWGLGHDSMQRHGGWNQLDSFGDPDNTGGWSDSSEGELIETDQYRSMRNVTQPVSGMKVCNKTQLGFTVLYWIKRPCTWEFVQDDTGDDCWQAISPYFYIDALSTGSKAYYSFPLNYNFNFNITVVS